MARTNTRIGDIFSVKLSGNAKKFFQYISNDMSQLNSDVIRAFKKQYPANASPELTEIIKDEIDFYAHCDTKQGVKMKLWEKVGNLPYSEKVDILFKSTSDYGHKVGEVPIRASNNWYVWKINEEHINVGKLEGKYKNSFIGMIINPLGIIELLKGNKYPINYPD